MSLRVLGKTSVLADSHVPSGDKLFSNGFQSLTANSSVFGLGHRCCSGGKAAALWLDLADPPGRHYCIHRKDMTNASAEIWMACHTLKPFPRLTAACFPSSCKSGATNRRTKHNQLWQVVIPCILQTHFTYLQVQVKVGALRKFRARNRELHGPLFSGALPPTPTPSISWECVLWSWESRKKLSI